MKKNFIILLFIFFLTGCSSPLVVPEGGEGSTPHVFLKNAVNDSFYQTTTIKKIDECNYIIHCNRHFSDNIENRVKDSKNKVLSYMGELCRKNDGGDFLKGNGQYICFDLNGVGIYQIDENVKISPYPEKIGGYSMKAISAKYQLSYLPSKKLYDEINSSINNINHNLKIVDESGLYDGEEIFSYGKSVEPDPTCVSKVEDFSVKFNYWTTSPIIDGASKYELDLKYDKDSLNLAGNDKIIDINVVIRKRNASRLVISDAIGDDILSIANIVFDKKKNTINLTVKNNSNRYIEVKNASFHYKSNVKIIDELKSLVIPPSSHANLDLDDLHNYVKYKSSSELWGFDKEKLEDFFEFGISAEYLSEGKTFNFFSEKKLKFKAIVILI